MIFLLHERNDHYIFVYWFEVVVRGAQIYQLNIGISWLACGRLIIGVLEYRVALRTVAGNNMSCLVTFAPATSTFLHQHVNFYSKENISHIGASLLFLALCMVTCPSVVFVSASSGPLSLSFVPWFWLHPASSQICPASPLADDMV